MRKTRAMLGLTGFILLTSGVTIFSISNDMNDKLADLREKSAKEKQELVSAYEKKDEAYRNLSDELQEQDVVLAQREESVKLLKEDKKKLTDKLNVILGDNKKLKRQVPPKPVVKSVVKSVAAPSPKPVEKKKPAGESMDFIATAYTISDEEGTKDGITFSETRVTEGRTIAVDPDVIPIGTKVFVESDSSLVGGYYIAEDTGSAVNGRKIDIYMQSRSKAIKFGKQKIKLTIVR